MGRTLLDTNQFDGVQRDDLDITTTGQAVARKIIQGDGVTLSSTGTDAGTGDVTVGLGIAGLTVDASPDFAADYLVTYDASASAHKKILLPTLAHGTYTPTLTGVTNVASSAAYVCQYLRVGNTVTVSGQLQITPTSGNTYTELGVSLPIASAFTADRQLGGSGGGKGTQVTAALLHADITNDRAHFETRPGAGSQEYFFSFTYLIL